MAGYIRSHNQF